MDKGKIILMLFGMVCLSSLAQKPAGYFGKRNLIGYEYTFRPFGKYDYIERVGGGFGKIKLERIISKNRSLGINAEKIDFLINNAYDQFYLHNKTFAVYMKKFNSNKAMVPIGNYHIWSLENSRNSFSLEKKEKTNVTYKMLLLGFDLGRAFPIGNRHFIFNVSAGLRLRLLNGARWRSPLSNNDFIYERSMVKIDAGLAYAF